MKTVVPSRTPHLAHKPMKGFPSDQPHCLIRSHGISNKLNYNLLIGVPEKMHEEHGMPT